MLSATPTVTVAELRPADHAEAVGVIARGMRDNPIHVAVFGPDPERRERLTSRLFTALFAHWKLDGTLCVREDDVIVGVAGALGAGACRPGPAQALRMLPTMAGLGPRTTVRMAVWQRGWAAHHPHAPHVHLGPVAVDAHRQGEGLGSVLLAEHCRRLDAAGATGYLETDKPENVRFYARQGYVVIAETAVLGVPCWFMRRAPA
jgi:GNAT superfamily N-acetyltransferase